MRRVSPAASAPSTFVAECTSAEVVGAFVHQSGVSGEGLPVVRLADSHYTSKMPSVGVVLSKAGDDRCVVVTSGDVVGLWSGLEVGKPYLVGLGGSVQRETEPAGPNGYSIVQHVAYAIATSSLRVVPSFPHAVRRT